LISRSDLDFAEDSDLTTGENKFKIMMIIIIINGEMRSNEKPRTASAQKVTAMRQLKADHPLTVQHTKPKI
jgi:hypothetical protein